jgi:4-aminobutyrate aminotransferase / (S)-3-amino-2-methylpropionate transaminase / 5-aminovalerate transaminase
VKQRTVNLRTEVPGPRSRELLERRQKAVTRGVSIGVPVFIESATGATMTDVDGNVFLDFAGGIGVLNVGSTPKPVVEAIKNQAEHFLHTCFPVAMYDGYLEVCETLCRLAPGGFAKKAVLVNSGAEAVENAVKISRAHTGRQRVIVFNHAFHGRTLLALTMTAKHSYKDGMGPFAPEVFRLPYPYPYRGITAAEALRSFEEALHQQLGAESVACVVMELVAGEGGFLVADPAFVEAVRQMCADEGIVFVADEVQTGFGRTGTMFASEHMGLEPDLTTIAKSVAGGLPLAGVVGKAEIMDAPPPGGLGSTYGGNPVACAAALAALEMMEREDLPARGMRVGRRVADRFHRMWEQYPLVGDARGVGAMQAIELVRNRDTKEPAPTETDEVYRRCWQSGLILYKAGTYGNVIRFLAPLTISDEELDEGLDILEEAVAAVSPSD